MASTSRAEQLRNLASYKLKDALPLLDEYPWLGVGDLSMQWIYEWLKAHPSVLLTSATTVGFYLWRFYQRFISRGTVLELDLEHLPIQESVPPLHEILGQDGQVRSTF